MKTNFKLTARATLLRKTLFYRSLLFVVKFSWKYFVTLQDGDLPTWGNFLTSIITLTWLQLLSFKNRPLKISSVLHLQHLFMTYSFFFIVKELCNNSSRFTTFVLLWSMVLKLSICDSRHALSTQISSIPSLSCRIL